MKALHRGQPLTPSLPGQAEALRVDVTDPDDRARMIERASASGKHFAATGDGSIVNMSSILGTLAYPQVPAYVASKHGVIGVTRSAALVSFLCSSKSANITGTAMVTDGGYTTH